jgi:hypothetical protein
MRAPIAIKPVVAYTTGQAAAICACDARVIRKWWLAGELPGWKLPGSRDLRIEQRDLIDFMVRHGYPSHLIPAVHEADGLESEPDLRVVVLEEYEQSTGVVWRNHVGPNMARSVTTTNNWLALGRHLGTQPVHAVIVCVGNTNDASLRELLRTAQDRRKQGSHAFGLGVVAPTAWTTAQAHTQLRELRCDAVFQRDVNPARVSAWLDSFKRRAGRRLRLPPPEVYPPLSSQQTVG